MSKPVKLNKLKIKRSSIVDPNFLSGLNKLCALPLDFKTGYEIALTMADIEKEVAAFNKGKISAIRKYGVQDEKDKDQFRIESTDTEALKKYFNEINEYTNVEIELQLSSKIKINSDERSLSPLEIKALLPIIESPI